ncbi:MAG: imidazole glycerol phosphate synthase, glutamine amidotransferase subunit [Planctomycetes bacterium RBG_13_46_10]|nr:MAG: imidazole glycerol phosphate synthase, glutamine amidotransferase subunit [Planctomycetes bacterium RBG_13_46_10]
MIVVIDYNVGNVKSVCNALRHIGCQVTLSRKRETIEDSTGIVLPGVAAFGYAINQLGELAKLIKKLTLDGKPLLGICVGYQMLFDQSSEYGRHDGLGLISGSVIPIPINPQLCVPHMGWNQVKLPDDMDLFTGLGKEKTFYFAHSFYADVTDLQAKTAFTDYGFAMPAAVQKANIYGVQFHPEKSSITGLKVLKNFVEICLRNE